MGIVLRRKKDDILIIQSSSMNSGASRRYQSTESDYSEKRNWNNATGEGSTLACSSVIHKEVVSASYNGSSYVEKEKNKRSEHDVNSETPANDTGEAKPEIQNELEDLMGQFKSYRTSAIPTIEERLESIRNLQQQTLNYLIRILFGKEPAPLKTGNEANDTASNPAANTSNGQTASTGGHYESFYYYSEKETTCFQTTGTAITADGRELSFHISLEMSRSFTEMASESIDFGQPRLCDPLVINLNTNVASVSDQKFFFDLDADGTEEEISMLDANSGYLALDNNNDGKINDGSELFGTQSGNGFKDLLTYDKDGNGWIDEADPIFSKLKIWTMDEDGNATLMDLKEAGVGAIYLGYENTEFSLKNAANQTNAVIQKTGMFLYEDGTSGTVQQMDLAV